MLDKKNIMDESALSEVNGGADKGTDEQAARTIKIPCNSAMCKGQPRIYDVFLGGRAICRACGNEINI